MTSGDGNRVPIGLRGGAKQPSNDLEAADQAALLRELARLVGTLPASGSEPMSPEEVLELYETAARVASIAFVRGDSVIFDVALGTVQGVVREALRAPARRG